MSSVIDKQTIALLHADINAALKTLAAKHGMAISMGTLRYSPTGFSAQLSGAVLDAAEQGDERLDHVKAKDIENAKKLGFFGKTVVYAGASYEIVGHNGYVLLGWNPRKQSGVRFNQAQTAQVLPQLRAPYSFAGASSCSDAPSFTPSANSALSKYIAERNANFSSAMKVDSLSVDDKRKLADSLEADLSPENLCCDGEASAQHVRTRGAFLRNAAAELLVNGGPRVNG
jgi:hypothetical protein